MAIYVNEKWCKQAAAKYTFCNEHLDYQEISCRPFYLPREFGCVTIINVYVPPTANDAIAHEQMSKCIDKYDIVSRKCQNYPRKF